MSGYGNEFDGARSIHTETSPENLAHAVALIAQTAYRIHNHDKITDEIIERYANVHKLGNADFLESATRRCDILVSNWVDFGMLYDYNQIEEINKSITADDVIRAAKKFFDGPMSIMTFGAEYNADLRKIWTDNFK